MLDSLLLRGLYSLFSAAFRCNVQRPTHQKHCTLVQSKGRNTCLVFEFCAASPQQRAALLEARGRLRDMRRKQQASVSASRWGAALWWALRRAMTVAAAVAGVVMFLAASGIIAGYAVSGFGTSTQVSISCLTFMHSLTVVNSELRLSMSCSN